MVQLTSYTLLVIIEVQLIACLCPGYQVARASSQDSAPVSPSADTELCEGRKHISPCRIPVSLQNRNTQVSLEPPKSGRALADSGTVGKEG